MDPGPTPALLDIQTWLQRPEVAGGVGRGEDRFTALVDEMFYITVTKCGTVLGAVSTWHIGTNPQERGKHIC